jgi:hypothetical protein
MAWSDYPGSVYPPMVTAPLRARRALALAAGALALAITQSAAASPESEAKDLFARGRELRDKNDCGSAAPLFLRAWTVYPNGLGSVRNLAECEEALGHYASARRYWLDLKRALIVAPNDPKYENWDRDAEESAARLKPRVATFIVDVYVKSSEGEALANDKSGIQLFVNGEALGVALVSIPIERDPGTYRIRAQAEDAPPVEQQVTLAAGDNPHVTIRLTRTPKPETVDAHATRRTIGWVVGGIGAAALVGSGITFLVRNGAESDVDEACPSHQNCPRSIESTVDTGKTMSTLTSILFPVGLVGLGAGVVLVLTSQPKRTEPGPPPSARHIRITPLLGGLGVGGRF